MFFDLLGRGDNGSIGGGGDGAAAGFAGGDYGRGEVGSELELGATGEAGHMAGESHVNADAGEVAGELHEEVCGGFVAFWGDIGRHVCCFIEAGSDIFALSSEIDGTRLG